MQPYERFDAWNACHRLVLAVYRSSKEFPAIERYGLTSQAKRAAFSAASNIVEGSARRGAREFRHYLSIAVGSLAELAYTLQVMAELDVVSEGKAIELMKLQQDAARLTMALYRAISRTLR